MALNKKRTVTATATATKSTEGNATASAAPAMDMTALQTALAQIVQLVTDLSGKLEAANGRIDELSGKVDDLESKLNAALEDDEDADGDDEDADGDDEDADGDDVTADDIDCNKAYKQLTSMDIDQQKEVLVEAMKSLGVKNLVARTIRKDANAALAVAEVMCSEKFGWDVDDFLKD
jgi:TolA-binding protein